MGSRSGNAAQNVLLKTPSSREREFDCCVDLLTPTEPAHLDVWSLGITLAPDERLRMWEARQDAYPHDFRIVSGRPLPQSGTVERARELGFDTTPRFTSLEDPKNLTRLGVELTESLQTWEGNGRETVVCFHSITALLQHVSTARAFQFLHPFTNKVREFGATAHYHLDPLAVDERDVRRLSPLFDRVAEPQEA